MGLFDKAKGRLQTKKTASEINKWLDAKNNPDSKYTEADVELIGKKLKSITLVGEQYACRKDKSKTRRAAEKGIKIGSKVYLEHYTYRGEPAYMVVNPKNGLDFGVISKVQAAKLAARSKEKVIQGEIVEQYADAANEKHWKVYLELDD